MTTTQMSRRAFATMAGGALTALGLAACSTGGGSGSGSKGPLKFWNMQWGATAFQSLVRQLRRALRLTVVMVTHDLKEAFALGTRLIALDKKRRDPQAPERYGAIVTYDLDLTRESAVPVLGFIKSSASAE